MFYSSADDMVYRGVKNIMYSSLPNPTHQKQKKIDTTQPDPTQPDLIHGWTQPSSMSNPAPYWSVLLFLSSLVRPLLKNILSSPLAASEVRDDWKMSSMLLLQTADSRTSRCIGGLTPCANQPSLSALKFFTSSTYPNWTSLP